MSVRRKNKKDKEGKEANFIIEGREERWRVKFVQGMRERGTGGGSSEARTKRADRDGGRVRFKRRRSIKSLIKGLGVTRFRLRDNNVHYGSSDA